MKRKLREGVGDSTNHHRYENAPRWRGYVFGRECASMHAVQDGAYKVGIETKTKETRKSGRELLRKLQNIIYSTFCRLT